MRKSNFVAIRIILPTTLSYMTRILWYITTWKLKVEDEKCRLHLLFKLIYLLLTQFYFMEMLCVDNLLVDKIAGKRI